MAARDDLYFSIMLEIVNVLRRIRIRSEFENPNFIPSKGESVYSTFLRALGLLTYPDSINSRIDVAIRVERGKTIADRLLKPKTQDVEDQQEVFISFLKALLAQLQKYIRDTNLTQIKRIRKLIGPPVNDARATSKQATFEPSGDIAQDIQSVNEQLQQYDLQRDGIGQLVQEIDLLSNFTASLSALIRSLFQTSLASSDATDAPLGPLGGPFVSIIRAQTAGYTQRLDRLTERRVNLNAQLALLQEKMRYIRSGADFITGESLALISIVDTLLYLFTEVTYTCKQCKFYSTQAAGEEQIQAALASDSLSDAERARLERAQERATNIQDSLRQGDETGFCLYRAANLPTVESGSCLSVWGLPGNDYWSASDNAEDGREDIVTPIKQRLNPRSR